MLAELLLPNVNGTRVEATATSSSYDAFADILKLAIDEAANDNPSKFSNIEVSIDPNSKLITLQSTNAGIPFQLSGAYSTFRYPRFRYFEYSRKFFGRK